MPQDPNLQNEINQILDTNQGNVINTVVTQPTQSTVVETSQPQFQSQQVNPIQSTLEQPVVTNEQPQITQPENQSSFNQDQAQSFLLTILQFARKNTILLSLSGVGLLIFLAILLSTSTLGAFSYKDCTEIEGSTIVSLKPAYCVTPKGDVFFQNKNEAMPVGEEVKYIDTFDPNNPPETILPEI